MKETKILLVSCLQRSLSNLPENKMTTTKIIAKVRSMVISPSGSHPKQSTVLFLNDPSLKDPQAPDELYNIYGTDPYRRKLGHATISGTTIDCPWPDPFLHTPLDPILTNITAGGPYKIEICGYGYHRPWFAAIGCASRGLTSTILMPLCNSMWAYEFQGSDRVLNSLILYQE